MIWVEPKVVSTFPHGSHMAGMDGEGPPSSHVSRCSKWSPSMVILSPASQATVAEIDLCVAGSGVIGSFCCSKGTEKGMPSQNDQEGSVGLVSKFACEIISMWVAAIFSDTLQNLPTALCDHDFADVASTTSFMSWTKLCAQPQP